MALFIDLSFGLAYSPQNSATLNCSSEGHSNNGKQNYERLVTGKSLSEALIFASTNPQYDERLFIELQVQYMKIPSS